MRKPSIIPICLSFQITDIKSVFIEDYFEVDKGYPIYIEGEFVGWVSDTSIQEPNVLDMSFNFLPAKPVEYITVTLNPNPSNTSL